MKIAHTLAGAAFAAGLTLAASADAEILAMMNYETKSPDSLKTLKTPIVPQPRKEGIAIMDVDPASPNFGNILIDIPLPADLIAHHLFYNRDMSKIYLTALGQPAGEVERAAAPGHTVVPVLHQPSLGDSEQVGLAPGGVGEV